MLDRVLEPEVMDSDEDAREYDLMDHAAVNAVFVADLMGAVTNWSLKRPVRTDAELKVLDLGAGTAQIPIELCRLNREIRVVAVDAAESMLAVARTSVAAAGLAERIELVLADAKRLPFRDELFPIVVSNSIVHHIAEPAGVLAEAVRVATPGGLQFHRDLARPQDEVELARIVDTYTGGATAYQRKLFSESLRAALSLHEIASLIETLGFPRDGVRFTWFRLCSWLALVGSSSARPTIALARAIKIGGSRDTRPTLHLHLHQSPALAEVPLRA
jgi:ubiquinone/menaquinone biosynthesis C-methylase UbiE